MIIEMRTYQIRPGGVPEYERRVEAGLAHRTKFSPLAAWWHTEIGPLNQVIHLWPYESMAQRDEVRAAAVLPGVWPPDSTDLVLTQESKILAPTPFSPPLEPAEVGPIFEVRSYQLTPGSAPAVTDIWAPMMERRLERSPLVLCGSTQLGPLHQWVHIWAYRDMNERAAIRAQAVADGVWPPSFFPHLVTMENLIALPASFSPIR